MDFSIDQYEQLAEVMKAIQDKVILSINDHPDMRAVFDGLNIGSLKIKYALNNRSKTETKISSELVIKN